MPLTVAGLLLLATWLLLRIEAGRFTHPLLALALLPLDVAPILGGWAFLFALTGRPMLAAAAVLAGAVTLAIGDWAKRASLREPLVFADRAEAIEVVRHPRLYIPFAGPVLVAAAVAVIALTIGGLAWLEPAAGHPPLLPTAVLCAALVLLPTAPAILPVLGRFYRRLGTSNDPAADMRRFGFLSTLVMQATVARAERPARHAALPPLPPAQPDGQPIVLLQIESFFDPTRLGPGIPAGTLANFARLKRQSLQHGPLTVPCWGANTVRTEFEAITGISVDAVGLDRFNPYERFARTSTRSLASVLKAAGYRTICLHPFDPSFYGRNTVMPAFGFDAFYGPEHFPDADKAGPYVSDPPIAEAITRIIAAEGPRVFIFAITMGNHGPWHLDAASPPHTPVPVAPGIPDGAALAQYLGGLAGSDRMLAILADTLPGGTLLAAYGDHQPSLPKAFDALGLRDEHTDYLLWRAGHPGPATVAPAAAPDLAALILGAASVRLDIPTPNLP